jgi:hypothetical protein
MVKKTTSLVFGDFSERSRGEEGEGGRGGFTKKNNRF